MIRVAPRRPSPSRNVRRTSRRRGRGRAEGSGLLEEVSRTGNDLDAVLAEQAIGRALVELEHDVVLPADDQQGRRLDRPEAPCGEVRASAPRDDRADPGSRRGRCPQRGSRARARTEESDRQPGDGRLPSDPHHRSGQAARKQFDVEDIRAIGLFDGCQQVEEQRSDPSIVQEPRHRPISRCGGCCRCRVRTPRRQPRPSGQGGRP